MGAGRIERVLAKIRRSLPHGGGGTQGAPADTPQSAVEKALSQIQEEAQGSGSSGGQTSTSPAIEKLLEALRERQH